MGLAYKALPFDPWSYYVSETQSDDIPGCGEAGVLYLAHRYVERRFGTLALQEKSFTRLGDFPSLRDGTDANLLTIAGCAATTALGRRETKLTGSGVSSGHLCPPGSVGGDQ